MHAPTLRSLRAPLAFGTSALAATAQAHVVERNADAALFPGSFDPWVLACLAASGAAYAIGTLRLWRRAGIGRGIGVRNAAAFVAGWLVLVVALVSPLDPLGVRLFSAHMLQHELLMIVAAPLLVLARPLAAWTWALPARARAALGASLRTRGWRCAWRTLCTPLVAALLHALALWTWHAPAPFARAIADPFVHGLQHASFLGTALLFWWVVLGARAGTARALALLALFATMLHGTVLGTLIALSPHPWYPAYGATSAALGIDALRDQQLGGLLMWVPGGLAYVGVGIALAARWLDQRVPAARARPSAT